jgi:hypothetical protein
MDTNILSITDPKDLFIIMLLERLEKLEDKVAELDKIQYVVPDGVSSFQSVQALKLAITCSTAGIEDAKKELETCCHLVEERFKQDAILKSVVADLILDEAFPWGYPYCCRIYLNFTRSVWIHEVTRVLTSIKYPVKEFGTSISKGAIVYYKTEGRYSHIEEHGIAYSLYDKDGNRKENPIWEPYHSGFEILTDPYPNTFSDGLSDYSSDYWPEQEEQ